MIWARSLSHLEGVPGSSVRPDGIAVIGPGAVGLTLAARLAAADPNIALCGRAGAAPVTRIEVLEGTDRSTVPVRWLETPAGARPVRWVVLATKLHHVGQAGRWLDSLVGPDTVVVAAQNGIEHRERLEPWAMPEQVVPAIVQFNAGRTGRADVQVGRMGPDLVLPAEPAGVDAARLLVSCGFDVEVAEDFRTRLWRKFMVNVVANPITALTCRRVEVFRDPAVRDLTSSLLEELVALGRAAGAELSATVVEDTLAWIAARPAGAGSSMLDDRLAGRALEHDGLVGAAVRAARRYGVPVPLCVALHALVASLDVTAGRTADSTPEIYPGHFPTHPG